MRLLCGPCAKDRGFGPEVLTIGFAGVLTCASCNFRASQGQGIEAYADEPLLKYADAVLFESFLETICERHGSSSMVEELRDGYGLDTDSCERIVRWLKVSGVEPKP